MNNRKIKFRIYDSVQKEWVHGPGNEINLLGETIIFGEILRRPDDTAVSINHLNELVIQQFTGLLDKNGKEIYEGDILYDSDCFGCITGGDLNPDKRKVIWNAGEAKFELDFIDTKDYAKTWAPSGRFLCKGNADTYEIVGNIFDTEKIKE